MSGERVIVEGLAELRRNLRQIDRRLPKEISKAGKKAANIVVAEARPHVPTGPQRGGHAAMSIKPRSTQKGASVSEGGARYPYMPWLDMGGTIRPHAHQEIHRAYYRKGRFIWAAFARRRREVLQTYMDALRDALQAAGLDPE